MVLTQHIAKHFRDVHFGGNWTCVNLRDTLTDVNWEEANAKVRDMNTILTLTYHMYYYVAAVLKVLQGEPLNAKDEYSFKHPAINSQEEWESLLQQYWADVETFAALLEQLPEAQLLENFSDAKYGNYYRNMAGITEHTHYHMGQIVIVKKILKANK
jgi:uncharacterized damage-inducible protein DinB